ncbi:MAG TPA: LytTR family DNA-binding domain-containing protein [Bryobacteraceae bacterium]|nr:LytTR family DNA-binding domain-containing protein [Bryobacteraceae bacterium]
MKALLIDDEPLARLELRRLLQRHPEVEIAGEARDGEEALGMIRGLAPELLFLDIQMPGMDGFALLTQLGPRAPDVIFTTAFDQHALQAFEVNALDYLLKPIAPARLAAALGRVAARPEHRPAQVFLREGERCWVVRVGDIFLLESEGNYTRVHFPEASPLIRRSLQAVAEQLDPALFFRANRQQIVNLQSIQKMALRLDGGLSVLLPQGKTAALSRRQSDLLQQRLAL